MGIQRICPILNEGLCFNYIGLRITYCTLTNANNGLGWPMLSKEVFDGKTINWDKFFEEREKEINAIKNNTERNECKNCQHICEGDFEDDKKIHYVLLSTWQVCNSDCIYCGGHSEPLSETSDNYEENYKLFVEPYDILGIIKEMIEKDILAKDAKIDFAGGEPTLYPKFEELVSFFIDNNYKNMIMHTNNINYSPAIERAIKADSLSLVVSVDAGSKKCHEQIKRVKSYDKVWENFKTYSKFRNANSQKRLCAKYIIIPQINDTKSEIKEFINKAYTNGATQVALNVYNQLLNEMNYKEDLLEHLLELSDFFLEEAKKYNLNFVIFPNMNFVYKKLNKQAPWDNSIMPWE